MKRPRFLPICLAVALAGAGCGPQEITPLQRKAAASDASEGQFALQLRDYARAEKLFAKATEACPDEVDHWVNLGTTRLRLGRRSEAKAAYARALKACEAAAARDKAEPELALQQVTVLALLGRVDDARALQTKLLGRFPTNPRIRSFVETKQLDRLLADPQFQKIAL